MSTFPQILQYGLPGLAAIIAFLAYRLLLDQSAKAKPNASILRTIKAFMFLGIVLATISLAGSTVELVTGSKHQDVLRKVEKQLTEANSEVLRLKDAAGSQETVSELEQKLTTAQAEIERLKLSSSGQQQLADLESAITSARSSLKEIAETNATQRVALNRFVTDRLEQEIQVTSGKFLDLPNAEKVKIQCALLRRAVFLHILDFQSNREILERALEHLVKRGHPALSSCRDTILSGFPELMALKLRWLEDHAIPLLSEKIQKISRSPIQMDAKADVPLPPEFVVVDVNAFGQPFETVTDLARLKEEVSLLKSLL